MPAIMGSIICGPMFMLPISDAIMEFMPGCIIGAPPLAIMAVVPVIIIVRRSEGSWVSWSSGMPEKFCIGNEQHGEHPDIDQTPEKKSAHHDVSFEDSCEVAKLAPSVTVRLPTDLIEPVVEPIADV
jgi:hypothetical protein